MGEYNFSSTYILAADDVHSAHKTLFSKSISFNWSTQYYYLITIIINARLI